MKVTLVLCVLVGLAVALPETDITTSDIQRKNCLVLGAAKL